MRPSLYRTTIMQVCNVEAKEADLIEKVMREASPTLDRLTARDLKKLAINSQRALRDPEFRKLYEEHHDHDEASASRNS